MLAKLTESGWIPRATIVIPMKKIRLIVLMPNIIRTTPYILLWTSAACVWSSSLPLTFPIVKTIQAGWTVPETTVKCITIILMTALTQLCMLTKVERMPRLSAAYAKSRKGLWKAIMLTSVLQS